MVFVYVLVDSPSTLFEGNNFYAPISLLKLVFMDHNLKIAKIASSLRLYPYFVFLFFFLIKNSLLVGKNIFQESCISFTTQNHSCFQLFL